MEQLSKEKSSLEKVTQPLDRLVVKLKDTGELFSLALLEKDLDTLEVIECDLTDIKRTVEQLEFQRMFSQEADECGAFLDIQAGSGGTEAQDWAEMLLRMYLKWAESKGFSSGAVQSDTRTRIGDCKAETRS